MPFSIGQDVVDEDSIPSSEEDCSNGASNDGAVDISDDIIGNDDSNSGKENVGNHSSRKRPPSDDERLHDVDKTKKKSRKSRKSRSHANKTKSSNDGNEATTPRSNPYPSTCTPTVKFVPKVSREWSKDPLTMDEITKKICLDDDYRKAVTVVMDYDGDNETLVSLKKDGYEDALQMHNNFVGQGCTAPPVRTGAVKHHKSMGSRIDTTGEKSNMPDLATDQHRVMGSMYYATEKERGYKHPDENLSHNRLDYDSQCPGLAATAIPNMAMYHTTGHYTTPERDHRILLFDKICVCLVKGDGTAKHLDKQCRKLLKDLGVLAFFEEKGVSLHAAMVAFIVPSIIFNVCQIYYNTKESVPMIAFGNPAADMWRNGGFFATEYCHGHGKAIHPDQLVTPWKMTTLQACANSDACTTEWLKPLLRKDLERLNLSVDKLCCFIAHKLMFGGMNDEEMRQVEESLPCYILHQMKLVVDKVKSKYSKDTPRWKMAMDLLDTEGTKIKRSWVMLYVKHSKSIRESAVYRKSIEKASEKKYLAHCKAVEEGLMKRKSQDIQSVASQQTGEKYGSISQRSEINLSNVPLQRQKHKFCSVQGCQNWTIRRRVCKKHGAFDDSLFARFVLNRDAQIGNGATQGQNQLLPNQCAQPQVYVAKSMGEGSQKNQIRKSTKARSPVSVVAAAVEEVKSQFADGTPIEDIVASLEGIDQEMKKAYLKKCEASKKAQAGASYQVILPPQQRRHNIEVGASYQVIQGRHNIEGSVMSGLMMPQQNGWPVQPQPLPPGYPRHSQSIGMRNMLSGPMPMLMMPQNGWPVQPFPPIQLHNDWQQQYIPEQMDSCRTRTWLPKMY